VTFSSATSHTIMVGESYTKRILSKTGRGGYCTWPFAASKIHVVADGGYGGNRSSSEVAGNHNSRPINAIVRAPLMSGRLMELSFGSYHIGWCAFVIKCRWVRALIS